jgi:hypothetical protein
MRMGVGFGRNVVEEGEKLSFMISNAIYHGSFGAMRVERK